MPWFRRSSNSPDSSGEDPLAGRGFMQYAAEDAQKCQADQDALERGTIPEGAKRRVQRTVSGEMPWMSTLSVSELF